MSQVIFSNEYCEEMKSGFTPRLWAKIEEAVVAVPLPAPRTYKEAKKRKTGWFSSQNNMVKKTTTPIEKWDWLKVSRDGNRLVVDLQASDQAGRVTAQTEIWGQFYTFTPQQAAWLGAEGVGEVWRQSGYSIPGGGVVNQPYRQIEVWWGTEEDKAEVMANLPHLCEK